MPTRKPRLSRMREPIKSRTKGQPPFKSGTLTRRFHGEIDPERLAEIHREQVLNARIRIARTTGLLPKEYQRLVEDLLRESSRYHSFPVDEKGNDIIRNVGGEYEIIGAKKLAEEKRKRNLQPVQNRISVLKKARGDVLRLREMYPGIDMSLPAFRYLSEKQRAALPFFKLSDAKQESFRKKYFELARIIYDNRYAIQQWGRKNSKQ